MNRETDAWLTRFAAGAGTLFDWQLIPSTDKEGRTELLLRAVTATQLFCPLSAQATCEMGKVFEVVDWKHAVDAMRLTFMETSRAVMLAADNDVQQDEEVRLRLLRICGQPYADLEARLKEIGSI